MDKMEVLINEFYQAEKIKIIREGTPKGFETVGGFLVSSLPPKKKKAKISDFQEKSLRSQRQLKKSKSEDIYIFKTQTKLDKQKILRYNTLQLSFGTTHLL